jgi:hypothetical protein
MHSRWLNAAVVLLWLAMMTWLVTEKVLPPLLVGEPPSYGKIVEAREHSPPVGWRISCNGRRLGWALSDTKLYPGGLTEMYGRVQISASRLNETMSGWMGALSRLIGQQIDQLGMDVRSVLTIDSLGRLVRCDSTVRFDPFPEVISVSGTVEGNQLLLQVRTGSASFHSQAPLPSKALLSDALSPQTQLPGLRAGQTWTVPIYSPLWPAKPLEIIYAAVEGIEPVLWNGAVQDAWLVVYRNEPAGKAGNGQAPRGKLWVRRDGTVLKQQVLFMGAAIAFVRLPDDEAAELVEAAGGQWWSLEGDRRAPDHD